jgi:hypothetical protein
LTVDSMAVHWVVWWVLMWADLQAAMTADQRVGSTAVASFDATDAMTVD